MDLTGQKFGHLTVAGKAANGNSRGTRWSCECDCGKKVVIYGGNLKRQRFCSNTCEMYIQKIRLDLSGKRFGRLHAVKLIEVGEERKARWQFSCDCGSAINLPADYVVNGGTKSCGCLERESRIKHGLSHTREYHRKAHRKWAKKHPALAIENASRRRKDFEKRVPVWLSKEQREKIGIIYRNAANLSIETGQKHHVDHIVPLRGKTVSGLHVPWNLQILPAVENLRKSYSFDEVC